MGASRAVAPNFTEGVSSRNELIGLKSFGQTLVEIQTTSFSAKTYLSPFFQRGGGFRSQDVPKPFGEIGSIRFPIAHQSKRRFNQLLFGLEKITAVRPKCSVVERDHRRSGTSVKTGHPFAALPVRSRILAVVRVAGGNDKSMELVSAHPLAQSRNAVGNGKSW